MNAGTLSFLLFLITAILLMSGWKELFSRNLSVRASTIFLMGWVLTSWYTIPIYEGIFLNVGLIGIVAVSIVFLASLSTMYRRMYVVTVTALIGLIDALLMHFVRVDPNFIWFSAQWDSVVVVVMCVFFAVQSFEEKWIAISMGMLVGDLIQQWMTSGGEGFYLGSAYWYDQWWLAMLAICLLTYGLEAVKGIGAKTANHVYHRLRSGKK